MLYLNTKKVLELGARVGSSHTEPEEVRLEPTWSPDGGCRGGVEVLPNHPE